MSDKPVPPSVAEFTLQERAQLQATIADQAREIERLKADLDECDGCRWKLRTELAALKSQPLGVVLPRPSEHYPSDSDGDTIAANARNACLDEVARLNSPPVSAVFQCPRCSTSMQVDPGAKPVSAGGVDERAADVLTRKFYVTVGVNKQGEAQAFFDYDQRFAEARTQHWKSTGYTAGLQVVYVDFLTTVNFPAETPEYLRSLTGFTARLEECGVRVFGDESRAG
jgi:hypothetical protein